MSILTRYLSDASKNYRLRRALQKGRIRLVGKLHAHKLYHLNEFYPLPEMLALYSCAAGYREPIWRHLYVEPAPARGRHGAFLISHPAYDAIYTTKNDWMFDRHRARCWEIWLERGDKSKENP